MFAEERLQEIVKVLHKEGKIIVKELSRQFGVTEDCIRKDLRVLESKGLLQRTYGGAVLLRKSASHENIEERKDRDVEAKKKIAEKAFQQIYENETIFLDISTINILLSQIIASSNIKVTVVTNMIDIVKAFSKNDRCKVVCIGGVYDKELDGFVGAAAIENITRYKVNKAFIGSCGIDIYNGSITTFDVEDGNTKKAIINASRQACLVMENEKFYTDGIYTFANLQDVGTVITEEQPEEEIKSLLESNDITIL